MVLTLLLPLSIPIIGPFPLLSSGDFRIWSRFPIASYHAAVSCAGATCCAGIRTYRLRYRTRYRGARSHRCCGRGIPMPRPKAAGRRNAPSSGQRPLLPADSDQPGRRATACRGPSASLTRPLATGLSPTTPPSPGNSGCTAALEISPQSGGNCHSRSHPSWL